MTGARGAVPATGTEWIVEARGCSLAALRDPDRIAAVFAAAVADLRLRPVSQPVLHRFPPPGGVTAFLLLAESHLACHTFPEYGYAALNLYCCRPRPAWDWAARLAEHLGATTVEVRAVPRGGLPGGPPPR